MSELKPRLPPVIEQCPRNQTAVRGHRAVLTCLVQATADTATSPAASVVWYYDGIDGYMVDELHSRPARITVSSSNAASQRLVITGNFSAYIRQGRVVG